MAESIFGPFVEKLADCTIAAISRQFKYMFCYNKNVQNLRSKVQDLENKRNDAQSLVVGAKRNAFVIKSEVKAWLKKVDDLKKEADEVLNSTTNSEMRCLYLRCPNLKTRYLLSRNATKKITAIVKLQEECKFGEVGVRAPLELPSFHGFEALKTRISTKEDIIKALEDKDISIVGICGLPGVGKTTMAKEVMTQVKGGLFDEVAMVVVSKDVDIIRIQDKLADMLGLKIDEKTNEIARAARLTERLTQDNKKRILVILDDVWTDINLETLGIPSLNRPEGLKILLTSRFEYVCKGMGAQRNIEVGVLPREEAFALFQEISTISNGDTQLMAIAKQVAEECKGLPLALEVVGKTLINSKLHEWRNALNQLQNSQQDDRVYSSIELSYNNLRSEEHRSLLLLCSLFPEDESIPIESLVRYARGLELFKYTETLLQTRDWTRTVSDNLKSCHLLLSGYREDEVKLHDVIIDFCLSIACKGTHRYMVKHDIRTDWPEHDNHESYGAISLTFQERILLPSRLQYENLKFLWVKPSFWPRNTIDIPEEFFDYMQELRVIDFSRNQIRSQIRLPPGLRTLCLNDCTLEIRMSFFGSLKKLEILSFYCSSLSFDFFRDEMVELSNLRLLDLRFVKGPCPLPPGFLFCMKKLEELYLGNYNNISYEEKEHIIQEVSSLKALNTLQIDTDDTRFLTQLFQGCSEKLEKFQITNSYIGVPVFTHIPRDLDIFELLMEQLERFRIIRDHLRHFRRELELLYIDPYMLLEPGIKSFMRRSDKLFLSVKGWNNPAIELVEDGFIDVKSLSLSHLDSEYLIDATGSIPSGILDNLEFLVLSSMHCLKAIHKGNLPRMENVARGVSEPALFRNLKEIVLCECAKIKRMFSESVAKCMVNLQELLIMSCQSLEEVVSMDTQENEITEPLLFPKLKKFVLYNLMSFLSFRSQPNVVGLHQTLLNQVELPVMEDLKIAGLGCIEKLLSMEETSFGSLNRLRRMRVNHCDNLVNIAESNSIRLLRNLENLTVHSCRAINVIFDFEGLNVNKDNEEEMSILSQLQRLFLARNDYLVHITKMVPNGIHVFQNLNRLDVAYFFAMKLKKSLEEKKEEEEEWLAKLCSLN
ncbi:disease resistance At4g27190-like [Olea europaea subsp. europaea]|uniref:Disease resistance At4g27190-like n=1 Tax=Olea europaea subsp. europaea TaxID=158383 RepID=A0A8S0UB61_OLEEU|nr:disease resistance At4g27190-like [Olea europaea subsp. europaea]